MTKKNPVLGESYEEHLKQCEFCQFMQAKKQTQEDRRSEFLNALHSEDTMPPKEEKQTAEILMEKTFRKAGESEDKITRTLSFMQMARVEEREKVLDESGILHGKDAERFLNETKLKGKI